MDCISFYMWLNLEALALAESEVGSASQVRSNVFPMSGRNELDEARGEVGVRKFEPAGGSRLDASPCNLSN